MPKQCCIKLCESTCPGKDGKRNLFQCPGKNDFKQRQLWINAIGNNIKEEKKSCKYLYICDLHFENDCFESNDSIEVLKDGNLQKNPRQRKRLKSSKLPTKFSAVEEIHPVELSHNTKSQENEKSKSVDRQSTLFVNSLEKKGLTISKFCRKSTQQKKESSLDDLLREWSEIPIFERPAYWGAIKTSAGLLFAYWGDTLNSISRTVLIMENMSIELQLHGRSVNKYITGKICSLQNIFGVLLLVSSFHICEGADESSVCPDGFFTKKPRSNSNRCKKCQLKRKKRRSMEYRREQRQLSKAMKNVTRKYKRYRNKVDTAEQALSSRCSISYDCAIEPECVEGNAGMIPVSSLLLVVKPSKGSNVEETSVPSTSSNVFNTSVLNTLLKSMDMTQDENICKWDKFLDRFIKLGKNNPPEYGVRHVRDYNMCKLNDHVQAYFSGFISHIIAQLIPCTNCLSSVQKSEANPVCDKITIDLSKGYLKYSSDQLVNLLRSLEYAILQSVEDGQLNVYSCQHIMENVWSQSVQFIGCIPHKNDLFKRVIKYYITCRMKMLGKLHNQKPNCKRKIQHKSKESNEEPPKKARKNI